MFIFTIFSFSTKKCSETIDKITSYVVMHRYAVWRYGGMSTIVFSSEGFCEIPTNNPTYLLRYYWNRKMWIVVKIPWISCRNDRRLLEIHKNTLCSLSYIPFLFRKCSVLRVKLNHEYFLVDRKDCDHDSKAIRNSFK